MLEVFLPSLDVLVASAKGQSQTVLHHNMAVGQKPGHPDLTTQKMSQDIYHRIT